MGIKKKNVFGVNFSERSLQILQTLNYVRADKKVSKQKNLSNFISQLVEDYVTIHPGINEAEINIQILKRDMLRLNRQQREIENSLIDTNEKICREKQSIEFKKNRAAEKAEEVHNEKEKEKTIFTS